MLFRSPGGASGGGDADGWGERARESGGASAGARERAGASAGESRAREPAQQIMGAGLRFGQRAEMEMARAPFLRARWSCPPRCARAKTAFFAARR